MREFGIFAFITKDFSGAFQELLSVTMPASLPLQLLKIPPKTLFVLKAFKFKHSLRCMYKGMNYFLKIQPKSCESICTCKG